MGVGSGFWVWLSWSWACRLLWPGRRQLDCSLNLTLSCCCVCFLYIYHTAAASSPASCLCPNPVLCSSLQPVSQSPPRDARLDPSPRSSRHSPPETVLPRTLPARPCHRRTRGGHCPHPRLPIARERPFVSGTCADLVFCLLFLFFFAESISEPVFGTLQQPSLRLNRPLSGCAPSAGLLTSVGSDALRCRSHGRLAVPWAQQGRHSTTASRHRETHASPPDE